MTVESSTYFRSFTEGSSQVGSMVLREKSSGKRKLPRGGAPVLMIRLLQMILSSSTVLLQVGPENISQDGNQAIR